MMVRTYAVRSGAALAVIAFMFAASHVSAQNSPHPTAEQIEAAHERLREGLGKGGVPPAAYVADPIPDWAVPVREPFVLGGAQAHHPLAVEDVPAPGATGDQPAPHESGGGKTETVTAPAPDKPADIETPSPAPTRKAAPEPRAPQVKTGRASAGEKDATPKPKAVPKAPPRPRIELPDRLLP